MGNADTASAFFGLMLGVLAQHATPARVEAAQTAPAIAIEKARDAAAAESHRAADTDVQAQRVLDSGAAAPGAATAVPAPGAAAVEATGAAEPPADAVGRAAQSGEKGTAKPAVATYDPQQHRDPFRPPILASQVGDRGVPRTPLEAYDIGQLRLVGIVNDDGGKARAMVEDSSGLGYIVTTGTPIGSSGGVVRSIEQRRVLIEEKTTDFYGEKQPKKVVMELPQEDRSP